MANTSTMSFTATGASAARLSDQDLLDATVRIAGNERQTTAELLALVAELDTRKLYLGQGYSSLFTYCTQRLRLSESAAYGRITAARAARRFPILFARLAEGEVTLTSISLLATHLTDDNHESLLDAARHASRRDVERLVASLHAQPDIPAGVRRVPGSAPREHDAGAPEPTKALQATLRPYQLDGYRWLCLLWSHQLGGILADDMGLGKTLQALALICHARLVCPEQPPFLVVAPTSVVSNWSSEAARRPPKRF